MSRILIVDDSSDLLEVLDLFLTEAGYEVKCIERANAIFRVIKEFKPDIIFLDIYLQGEDGREVCKRLRSCSETKYLCILLFSASDKELKRYKEYGADGYLEKPFGLKEVLKKVEATLERCKDYSPYIYE